MGAGKKPRAKLKYDDIKIGRVVGENEDGITLFIPKDMEGRFHLDGGEEFLTVVFFKNDGTGGLTAWTPWEEK